jgi:hypothetical protein
MLIPAMISNLPLELRSPALAIKDFYLGILQNCNSARELNQPVIYIFLKVKF